jgi:hypothetical protein
MNSRQWLCVALVAAGGALGGCGPGTPSVQATPEGAVISDDNAQRVTRSIAAMPSKVAEAATQVFSERGIPIANSNQVAGTVTGSTLKLGSEWEGEATAERVNCGLSRDGQPLAAKGTTELTIALEAKGDAEGSTTTLIAAGKNEAADEEGATGTRQGCILTTAFANELLDEIERRATSGLGAGAGGQPEPSPGDTTRPSPMPPDTTAPDSMPPLPQDSMPLPPPDSAR